MSSLTSAGSSEERYPAAAEEFDTRLSLEIGGGGGTGSRRPRRQAPVQLFGELLVVSPHLEEEEEEDGSFSFPKEDHHHGSRRQRDHPTTAARKTKRDTGAAEDATPNNKQSKKARTTTTTASQGQGGDRRSPGDGGGGSRKKLRLTAAQATMLEDSFRAHNILSHAEKQELARRVGLSARQVEVWFQNRRARTKLKQTEVDCDLLRRWCDRLTDENARLRHELADLRAAAASRSSLGAAAAVRVLCPSCCDSKVAAMA